MSKTLLKLSVFCLLLSFDTIAKADSLFLPINASYCEVKQVNLDDYDIYLNAYDKVSYLAVKSSEYVKEKTAPFNGYDTSIFIYKVIDNAVKDIITSSEENDKEFCLDFNAILDVSKLDELLSNYNNKKIKKEDIKKLSKEINESLPKSIYEANDSIPLLYIEDLEYYNKKTTKVYTNDISVELSFEPRILITENKELADYYIFPKLTKSAVDIIDKENSRYSMSLSIEVINLEGNTIIREEKNRYIIINNKENMQEIAHKMINKLIKEALVSIKEKISILLKE